MKLTIDTEAKTIKVEENVNLDDFIKELKKIVPNWKEYSLEHYAGVYYQPWIQPYYPQPYIQPYIYTGDVTSSHGWCDTTIAIEN